MLGHGRIYTYIYLYIYLYNNHTAFTQNVNQTVPPLNIVTSTWNYVGSQNMSFLSLLEHCVSIGWRYGMRHSL